MHAVVRRQSRQKWRRGGAAVRGPGSEVPVVVATDRRASYPGMGNHSRNSVILGTLQVHYLTSIGSVAPRRRPSRYLGTMVAGRAWVP